MPAGGVAFVQANAEPDLQQTGDRLKGLVAGMVEGALDLVAGPIEQQQQQQHPVCSERKVAAFLCCSRVPCVSSYRVTSCMIVCP